MIEDVGTASGLVTTIEQWGAEVVGESEAFAGWAFETGLHAAMAGELMVRAVELESEAEDGEPGAVSLERAFARNTNEAFFGIPFAAAAEFFSGKEIMTPQEFEALTDRYRAAGFASRTLMQRGMTNRAFSLIQQLLSEGLTLREVSNALRTDDEVNLGITVENRAALNMVTRTNVASAYGDGRWRAMNDPDVVLLRPYMLYVTAGDGPPPGGRVRPNHWALHLKVFRIGTALAGINAAPLGFQCRCSTNTLSQKALDRRGLTVNETQVPGGGPDPGWAAPPAPLAA